MGVLECLARAEGEVVSRNHLLDCVWPGADVTDDVLTHSVTELRKAFGDTPRDSKVIETIPKKGLRLLPEVGWVNETDSPADLASTSPGEGKAPAAQRFALVGLAIIVVGVAAWTYLPDRERVSVISGDTVSIAVKPFVDLSENQDQGHLARGLSEELALRLSGIEGVSVVEPRPSPETLTDFILDGSVRRFGDELRITVLLVDVSNDMQVWTHRFDSGFSDIFAMQDRIADGVAAALSVELDVGADQLDIWRTINPDAYEQVLLGDQYFDFRPEHMERARRHYTRATAIDPNYAAAWLRLATINNPQVTTSMTPEQREQRRIAESAIQNALALAPDSGEVLLGASEVYFNAMRWIEAKRYYDLAIEKGALRDNDAYADARSPHVHFNMLYKLGHVDAQIRLLEHAYRLQPYGGTYAPFLPQAYLAGGRYSDAMAEVDRAYEDPRARYPVSLVGLSVALCIDDVDLIQLWLQRVLEQMPARPDGTLVRMYDLLGDRDASLAWLRRSPIIDPLSDYFVLQWASYYDDTALALEAMQRLPDLWSFWIPLYAPLRKTDAFKDIVRDMGLVAYWREYGWGDYCWPTSGDDFECR